MTSRRALVLPAGDHPIDASLHAPSGAASLPTIVLLTDFRGIRPVYETFADRLADKGYAVLLPNLYYRSAPAPVANPAAPLEEAGRARLQQYRSLLTPEALRHDFEAYVRALDTIREANAERLAVIGYCMSGGFALRFAAAYPDRVRVAASFHGGNLAVADDPDSPHLLAASIQARLYIGHADQDGSAPPDQIARLDEALSAAGRAFTTEFYPGARHGFAIPDSPAYDTEASARHLARIGTLLSESLA